MRKGLDPNMDREEAILSIPDDRKIKNFRNEVQRDFSTSDAEYKEMVFPISDVFDCSDWRSGFNKFWNYDGEKNETF